MTGPDPTTYSHPVRDQTERKSNSRERNSARPTIGRALRETVERMRGQQPGPQTYNTIRKKLMGDESSVKVSFATAIRPISARPGKIRSIAAGPGPQSYKVTDLNCYMKRSQVIPNITFPTSGRESKSVGKLDTLRAKSPAPNLYRPKSATIL